MPRSIASHPAVVKTAMRRGKPPTEILLDISLHYAAMKKLSNKHKRGRPDIVHISLLEALESPLAKKGLLEIHVQTIEGHAIFIDPQTRIPRNYNRFTGLMEQLFKEGSVPPGSCKPLMVMKTMSLDGLLQHVGVKGFILLHEECERRGVSQVVSEAISSNLAVGIGGFAHGDFSDETIKAASTCYSIYDEPLATWVVVSRVIAAAELQLGVIK